MEQKKKKHKVGKSILIILLSVILLGVIAVLCLQFTGVYDFRKVLDKDRISNIIENGLSGEPEIIYQENAIADINKLFLDYYKAMVDCDQDTLKASVTDSSIYDDMTGTMQKAMLYVGYDNIDCYTVPGGSAQEYVVYVICNLTIAGVNSKPLDITSYYVVKTDDGYKIDNGVLNVEVTDFMSQTNADESIQALYQLVMEDTNYCIENDQTFADFYSEINSYN
jgi:hypothetical protein